MVRVLSIRLILVHCVDAIDQEQNMAEPKRTGHDLDKCLKYLLLPARAWHRFRDVANVLQNRLRTSGGGGAVRAYVRSSSGVNPAGVPVSRRIVR
jgi:hypothetical protein